MKEAGIGGRKVGLKESMSLFRLGIIFWGEFGCPNQPVRFLSFSILLRTHVSM
jgi:hypothetical protein